MTTAALEVTQNILPLRYVTLPGTALPLLRGFQPSSSSPHRCCMQASATLFQEYHPSGSDCVTLLLHACKPMTYTMAHRLQESSDDAAASRSLSMEARCVAVMFADMDIVSLWSPGCGRGSGTAIGRECQGGQAMAKPTKSRAQQTLQEQQTITELLAELAAIEERRQYAVRLHTLMHQRCALAIPIQYERLLLHARAGDVKYIHDHRRGTRQSQRRWLRSRRHAPRT